MSFSRGIIIDGELVIGTLNGLGVFKPTVYRRGAKGQLVMLPRPKGKPRRVSRVKRHNILKFVPLQPIGAARAVSVTRPQV